MSVSLHLGDCLDVMRTLEAESVDAVVTDPPYGLKFMSKGWDHGVPGEPFWVEALWIAKPGAYLLAFGGTRTFHRLTCAIEDAGWEVRDCLSWLYGQGFPKSLDVSKAIDKTRDDGEAHARVARFVVARMEEQRISRADVNAHFGFSLEGSGAAQQWTTTRTDRVIRPRVPKPDQWKRLKKLLSLSDEMDGEVERLNARKGTPSEEYASRPDAGYASTPGMRDSWTEGRGWNGNSAKGGEPVRATARTWSGWGTALKPAWEPIILARKPLVGTVAANVLKYGTGGINVDGCRIGTADVLSFGSREIGDGIKYGTMPKDRQTPGEQHASGRWPANVCLDEEAAEMLDEQSGERKSSPFMAATGGAAHGRTMSGGIDKYVHGGFTDSGGASRFYFTSKASQSDRNGGLGLDRSSHPTVKPLDLMRWLVRLVTPPGGVVLDPFMGSGTTGRAALIEGFHFVGIEKEREYFEIARRRIEDTQPESMPLFAEANP
jgi:hypothetical protein